MKKRRLFNVILAAVALTGCGDTFKRIDMTAAPDGYTKVQFDIPRPNQHKQFDTSLFKDFGTLLDSDPFHVDDVNILTAPSYSEKMIYAYNSVGDRASYRLTGTSILVMNGDYKFFMVGYTSPGALSTASSMYCLAHGGATPTLVSLTPATSDTGVTLTFDSATNLCSSGLGATTPFSLAVTSQTKSIAVCNSNASFIGATSAGSACNTATFGGPHVAARSIYVALDAALEFSVSKMPSMGEKTSFAYADGFPFIDRIGTCASLDVTSGVSTNNFLLPEGTDPATSGYGFLRTSIHFFSSNDCSGAVSYSLSFPRGMTESATVYGAAPGAAAASVFGNVKWIPGSPTSRLLLTY